MVVNMANEREPAEFDDDYEVPPPQSLATKKVCFRYLGPGQPLPLDEHINDERVANQVAS